MLRREREAPDRDERVLDAELRLAEALGLALLFVERLLLDFAADDFERDEAERDLVAPEVRPVRDEPLLDLLEPLPLVEAAGSVDHLPLITRFAASATASAISDPNLVALDSTDFAALSAVSAASMPASRIAFLAFGLALIAAAAAASPAASISLLMAALASFSVVDLDELTELLPELVDFDPAPDDLERALGDLDPVVLLDLAIANLPFVGRIDT